MLLPRLIGITALSAMGAALQPTGPADIVFRDVTVIAATGARPFAHTTVVVRGDRIAAIGPASETAVSPGAVVIDGTGRYLIPGLIDMHSHLSKARGSSLGLFVANGVTTLRDVGGDHEELLRWRREVVAGARVGPRILMAGPYLEAARNVERMRKDPPEERIEPFERSRIPVGSRTTRDGSLPPSPAASSTFSRSERCRIARRTLR